LNDDRHISSDQLARYLTGEAGAEERAAVEQWAAMSVENQRELQAMRAAWEMSAEGGALPDVDVDAAWDRVSHGIGGRGGARVIPIGRARAVRWLAVAAAIAGLVFLIRTLIAPASHEVMAGAGHVTATLDDSSTVVLSPGSELSARLGRERRIVLRGEAYFEVRRDEARPFIVDAGELRVTVLGTGFEVTAYDTAASVLVRVRHGRVGVEANGDTVVLAAGERARYDRPRHILQREAAPPMEVWGERILQFEGVPLADVAEELEGIFHVRIELADERIARCRLTATFEDEPIDAVLRVIAETFGLRVNSMVTGHYVLDGDGC